MAEVTIEYCVPCGFRDRALALQEAVLANLERELDSARLVMGDHGVFRVGVDGDTVYDKDEHDADYDVDDVVRAVREEL
jgi:selenoprotein W-related protein